MQGARSPGVPAGAVMRLRDVLMRNGPRPSPWKTLSLARARELLESQGAPCQDSGGHIRLHKLKPAQFPGSALGHLETS